MFRRTVMALAIGVALAARGATPRISYVRTLPPLRDLGGDDIALVYAAGDVVTLTSFVDTFEDRTNKSGDLRLDVVPRRQLFHGQPDEYTMRRIRREYPRDVYLGIDRVECSTTSREREGSTKTTSGIKVKRRLHWFDALCRVRLTTLDPRSGEPTSSFETKAEGTSPRVEQLGNEERVIAMQQAAHFAGSIAAASVIPRRVREAIELDDSAPEFDRAMLLVSAGRLAAARRLFEHALRTRGDTAALHYDIGAICEAMGDNEAAHRHYQHAIRLAPGVRKYGRELRLFRQRSGLGAPRQRPH
jgi:hypothetical protein